MKITDYALVFVGITLPFILIAYINIALTIRTFQQEMYYQKVIDSAVEDAMNEMKFIESDEVTNDYGYSGEIDNKVSINPQVAVDSFFKSIYGSMNILDDVSIQNIFNLYVPVLAVMDYNGVYISSLEKDEETGDYVHLLKPKRYFTMEYGVRKDGKIYIAQKDGWHEFKYNINAEDKEKSYWSLSDIGIVSLDKNQFNILHNIEFTTDDRIFDTCFDRSANMTTTYEYFISQLNYNLYTRTSEAFFEGNEMAIVDVDRVGTNEVSPLFYGIFDKIDDTNKLQVEKMIDYFNEYKKDLMTDIIVEELSYFANKNNDYAKSKGISYNFAFSKNDYDPMYDNIENVGLIALVQGIKVGNRYLNYKAYNYSDLEVTHKYYLSSGEIKNGDETNIKFGENIKFYHKIDSCIEYVNSKHSKSNVSQDFTYTKEAAAALGYYPCPICNP